MLAYHAAIETDFQTGIINVTNPHTHESSHKNDPDDPYWNEAMHGN